MHLDPFMKFLGFEGGVTGPGQARLTVQLRHEHLNNWGSAHGGFLFALADSAFALAANSHGPLAVSLSAHIEHLHPRPPGGLPRRPHRTPGQAGDILEATARESSLTRRTGVYQVEVRSGEALVALFTGTAYRKA
jgi:acyl-CoA thioesterase